MDGSFSLMLADAAAPPAGQDSQPMWSFFAPMIAVAFAFYFIILMPQRREQQKRESMLNAMKKNDRVVTSGGIIGSVANISPDGKEVTLKVSDSTRITFRRSAILEILGEDSGETSKTT